jgi:hypothetical protein
MTPTGEVTSLDDILGKLGRELAAEIARALAKELRGANDDGWVSQANSPLRPRRHCAAVRRRMGEGRTDCTRDGKLYLMTREALQEEMLRLGKKTPTVKAIPVEGAEPTTSVRCRLLRKLGRA